MTKRLNKLERLSLARFVQPKLMGGGVIKLECLPHAADEFY